jgi:archaeal flagellar protein FlaH
MLKKHENTVISTGSREIDSKMGGGIPLGSLTLIEGDSHAGKSVLVQQMTLGSLRDDFSVSYFTTENNVQSLVKQMDSLRLDILPFMLLRRAHVYPMEVARLGGGAVSKLLQSMKQEARRDKDMIFVDALTPCITTTPVEETLSFFEECRRICSAGASIVTTLHSYAVDQDLLVRIQSLCDAHLRLRTEEVGERLVKTMEVAKIRGASKKTGNIVSFEVEPEIGMRIIPISKAQG